MNNQKKIKIIADKLRAYLTDWKNEADHLNSFYYLSGANLQVYDDYLEGRELDENEQALIEEALKFKEIKFGKYAYKFEVQA
jgi:hypothetical protein